MWANKKESDSVSLNHQLKETESLLDKIYKRNFIYSKYYNLPALTSMYEYFVTGRCDDLAGPHGAYNMYEDEMRKDTVISQLSIVIQRLEQIKQNQYMLYQQVQIMNSNLNIISDSLSQIESYTGSIMEMSAINTYFASITARNAEISATMHLLNG